MRNWENWTIIENWINYRKLNELDAKEKHMCLLILIIQQFGNNSKKKKWDWSWYIMNSEWFCEWYFDIATVIFVNFVKLVDFAIL